jgi:HSP20 family protein
LSLLFSNGVSNFDFSEKVDEIYRRIRCRIRGHRSTGPSRGNAGPLSGFQETGHGYCQFEKKEVNQMVRWYYRSLFDELEDMRNYMESLTRQLYNTSPVALLPASGESPVKMLPASRAPLHVDVAENDTEVVVTADMIPGVSKKDISLDLINPQALEISCERKEEKKEEKEGYYMRERSFGSMTRVVPLPKPVTEDGSSSTFKNGVLEVHLKKTTKESRGKIAVD